MRRSVRIPKCYPYSMRGRTNERYATSLAFAELSFLIKFITKTRTEEGCVVVGWLSQTVSVMEGSGWHAALAEGEDESAVHGGERKRRRGRPGAVRCPPTAR